MSETSLLLTTVRELPWWPAASANLAELWDRDRVAARETAEAYPTVFAGDRAAMVVDVVASRQRRYMTRVASLVMSFSRVAHDLVGGVGRFAT